MLYTLASLKMILTCGHCVCDSHKVEKVSAHIYPVQVSLVAEVAISNACGD